MPYGNSDSILNAWLVSPSDTTVFPPLQTGNNIQITKAVYVGGTGNLNVVMQGGQTILFTNVQGGTVLPISVSQVKNTSTTATTILGLW
jgi:hypothetical protein